MKKPEINDYEGFAEAFQEASARAGKPKQYLVPYFIASHPGSDLDAMIDLALFLKRNGYRPDQVQDFIPAPFDIATCMYYTGLDPFTGEEVYTAKHLRDRKLQRALAPVLQARELLRGPRGAAQGGPQDLIGSGCDALIPANPPKAALRAADAQGQPGAGRGPLRPHRRGPVPGEARPDLHTGRLSSPSQIGQEAVALTPPRRSPPGEGPESLLQLPS